VSANESSSSQHGELTTSAHEPLFSSMTCDVTSYASEPTRQRPDDTERCQKGDTERCCSQNDPVAHFRRCPVDDPLTGHPAQQPTDHHGRLMKINYLAPGVAVLTNTSSPDT
jgi:hypothetical protein